MRSQSGGQPSVNGGSHLVDTELTIERDLLDTNLNTPEHILSYPICGLGTRTVRECRAMRSPWAWSPLSCLYLHAASLYCLHCIAFIVLCMYVTSSKETGHWRPLGGQSTTTAAWEGRVFNTGALASMRTSLVRMIGDLVSIPLHLRQLRSPTSSRFSTSTVVLRVR